MFWSFTLDKSVIRAAGFPIPPRAPHVCGVQRTPGGREHHDSGMSVGGGQPLCGPSPPRSFMFFTRTPRHADIHGVLQIDLCSFSHGCVPLSFFSVWKIPNDRRCAPGDLPPSHEESCSVPPPPRCPLVALLGPAHCTTGSTPQSHVVGVGCWRKASAFQGVQEGAVLPRQRGSGAAADP